MATNPRFNPQDYIDTFRSADLIGSSDRSKDLARDVALMNAQYDFDESWYNEHESFGANLDEMIAAGVNPIHAARAAMGNLASDSGSQPAASSNGYNASEALLNGVNSIGSAIGSVNSSIMTDLAMEEQDAKINKMQSEAALNFANAGEVAGISASTQFKNYASGNKDNASVSNIEAQTKLFGEEYNLTVEQTRLAKQVADSFPKMNEAEYKNLCAKTSEYWSQVGVNKATVEQMEHENSLIDAEKVLTEAKIDTEHKERDKVVSEIAGIKLQNNAQQQINEFQELIGYPLDADAKDVMTGYIEKSDYEGLTNFLMCTWDWSYYNSNADANGAGMKVFGNTVPRKPVREFTSQGQLKYGNRYYYNRSDKNPHD